ncbi:MAG: hypothetical protein A2079_01975 [Geobacteraceae bacterium GWC2_48_7]|nr:MAG: hypothetical protein A2079_01975 [Geobacteraceae bacterium GWC2_48_7]
MSKTVLVIFVRNPEPGKVKTRLAQVIGDSKACNLYQAMVSDILESAGKTCFPVFLFHDGDDRHKLPVKWSKESQRIVKQESYDLGQRMSAAFELLFLEGFERVVLMGSDIPGIDSDLIKTAVEELAATDVVIAPSSDGGYSLISIRKSGFRRELFQAIEWSSPQVLESTIKRCSECGLSYHLLDNRLDIDTMDDLMHYSADRSGHAIHTNAWLDVNLL